VFNPVLFSKQTLDRKPMTVAIPPHLTDAYQECQALAFGHYENFPVASRLLAKNVRPHIAALYTFARTADDFADEEKHEGTRLTRLKEWERNFHKALQGKPATPYLDAFAYTVRAFQIPLKLPLDLLKAFRMDVSIHRYASWDRVLHYCRHSANPVGRMVLLIHGVRDEILFQYTDYLCSGLQLINFWQDTSIDLRRNRIYYPKSELKKVGIRERDLLAFRDSPEVRTLVKNAVDFTEAYFSKGLPLLGRIRGRLKLELRMTYHGGSRILNKIRGMNYNVLQKRPVLNRRDKMSLVFKTLIGIFKTQDSKLRTKN
jgi:squalene synthase HpnC